ncbi:MAG: hypothetical protein ACRDI0_03220 [Actinomycetota bacterium]
MRTMLAGLAMGAAAAVAAWPLLWLTVGAPEIAFGLPATALLFLALSGGGAGALVGYVLRRDAQRRGEVRLWSSRRAVILAAGVLGFPLGGWGGGSIGAALCHSCGFDVFEWVGVGIFFGIPTGAGIGVTLAHLALRLISERRD